MHTERENLAPIAGGGHVMPGPIRGHCPEPTEIVCVEVKKIFDFCFQEHRVERTFPVPREVLRMEHHDHGRIEVECEIEAHKITCREVGERREVPNKKDRFLVCVAIDVPVTFRLFVCDTDTICSTFTRVVTVRKNAGYFI